MTLARMERAIRGNVAGPPTSGIDAGRLQASVETESNPERRHLLHNLVKEVRVPSTPTTDVWYGFPRLPAAEDRFVDSHRWLPGLPRVRTGVFSGNGPNSASSMICA